MPRLVLSIDGRRETVDVSGAMTHAVIGAVATPPKEIIVDPDGWWLMKWTVTRAK